MFFENLQALCDARGVTPSGVCAALGYSNASATGWRRGSVPQIHTRKKIADYFGIPVEHLTEGLTEDDLKTAASKPAKPKPDPLIPEPTSGLMMRIAEAKKSVIPAVPDAVIMPDNSMVLDCIPKAAKLRLRKTTQPEENDIVAGCLNNEIFVRRWHRKLSSVVLSAANPKYAPILTDLDELTKPDAGIYGVVEKVEFEL